MTKRELVTKFRQQADDYHKAAKAFRGREAWDKHLKPYTKSEHLDALAKMADEHAMALDIAS